MTWLLAALLGGYFFVNTQATPDKAAEMAEHSLRQQYPGATVNVEIEGKSGPNVLKGRFKKIRVEMANLEIQDLPFTASTGKNIGRAGTIELVLTNLNWGGLHLQEAYFAFQDVHYDLDEMKKTGALNIVKAGPATARLKISQETLHNLVAVKLKDVTAPRTEVQGGRLKVSGNRVVFGLGVPFEMDAVPVGSGARVLLESPQIRVGGVPLPAPATRALMQDVNPMFVFDRDNKWPFAVALKDLKAENGVLEINGDLPFRGVVPPAS